MTLDDLVRYFETLSRDGLALLPAYYAPEARFKDPFNEARGTAAIQHVFVHMFDRLEAPRFIVTGRVADAGGAMLMWDFHFGVRVLGRRRDHVVRGASHFTFDRQGRVLQHRDYWDTGEELYMKVPLLRVVMRALRRRLSAGPPTPPSPASAAAAHVKG